MTDTDQLREQQLRRNGRRTMLLIFGIMFGPMLVAYLMWTNDWLMPRGTINKGELILPPLQLEELQLSAEGARLGDRDLEGHWSLVVFGDGDCGERCEHALYLMRQVNIALGREADRVQRFYVELSDLELGSFESATADAAVARFDAALAPDLRALIAREHQGLHIATAPKQHSLHYIGDKLDAGTALSQSYIFVMDPLGNLMLYFTPEHSGKDMLTDLKKLLKNSKIG